MLVSWLRTVLLHSGAEAAIIPEDSTDVDQLAQFMERGIP
jgi:hypothetical protein